MWVDDLDTARRRYRQMLEDVRMWEHAGYPAVACGRYKDAAEALLQQAREIERLRRSIRASPTGWIHEHDFEAAPVVDGIVECCCGARMKARATANGEQRTPHRERCLRVWRGVTMPCYLPAGHKGDHECYALRGPADRPPMHWHADSAGESQCK